MSLLAWFAAVAVLLGVLILVHELGHFVFAKIFDVKVLRFSLGFGPRLLGFSRGETEYQLSLVPLGGYVRLLGEDPAEPIPPVDRNRALAAKPLWQRYTIVVAGPVFNVNYQLGQDGIVGISAQDAVTTTPLLAAIEDALWRDGRLPPEPPFDGMREGS